MMRKQQFHCFLAVVLLCGLAYSSRGADAPKAPASSLVSPYIFTDEKAVVTLPSGTSEVAYSLKTITRQGFGPTKEGQITAVGGRVKIAPLTEGIHILELKTQPPQTLRFLAMSPPQSVKVNVWRKALPRVGAKLASGKPFKILAMGDSVTHTGDYESLLVRMLERATGNHNISFVDRSYSGRSADATVREWINDGPPNHPDLGLLMYGLNDQITNVPLDTYLEEYQWVAERLHEMGADCTFLQPTPDISIPLREEDRKPTSSEPPYVLRTLGFGEALRPLAREMKVPVAETFSAVWGEGGDSLEDAARRLLPIFPPSYSKQFESIIENNGKGDTIHLNVLGHLQIARAVFESLTGVQHPSPWQWSAQTQWTPQGAVSTITAKNVSKGRRVGRLEVQPPSDAQLQSVPVSYDLAPGQTTQIAVLWLQASQPTDLLIYPANRYLGDGKPVIPVVDTFGDQSHVYAATAPFEVPAAFRHDRQVVTGQQATATFTVDGKPQKLTVPIPTNSQVGRVPLVKTVEHRNQKGWAVGELVYVRYGAARSSEANVDGQLDEWQNALWVPMGDPVQARSWRGPEDNRANQQEFDIHTAFKAGQDGIYLAIRTTGTIEQDNFTLFFDPREPKLLGTVGRYYWVSGQCKPDGQIMLKLGETSPKVTSLKGVWKKSGEGATTELFVPYNAMDITAWPISGDLGLSPIWVHTGADDNKTTLMWSENGHWWTPRWYGVVRRTEENDHKLPYMVRVN